MTQLTDVTGTAFIVAEYRAWENDEEDPLYRDTIVPLFLNEETKEAAGRIAAGLPVSDGVRLRTRYLDDRLNEQLAGGCKQVVILGSGLDTRAVRKAAPGVRYFEIDDASILDFKRERFESAKIEAPVVLVAGDYVQDDFLGVFESHGFDRALPAYVIWEGNTMYLSGEAVLHVLTTLREGLKDFAISFDFVSQAVIDQTAGTLLSSLVEHFADMGAPFTFGIDDINALAAKAGLTVTDVTKVTSLYRRFWPGRDTDWDWYDNYALCTLSAR